MVAGVAFAAVLAAGLLLFDLLWVAMGAAAAVLVADSRTRNKLGGRESTAAAPCRSSG